MMFLIRTAFWLSLVIMLIPVDSSQPTGSEAADAAPVGAGEAADAAEATLSDVGGFCTRNPGACDVGARIGTTFMLKARAGARMVYEFIDAKLGTADHGTLTAADLAPAWRGPDAAGKRGI